MRVLKENLLIQFSIVSIVIIIALAIALALIFTVQFNKDVALLKQHGAVMMSGTMIQDTDPFSIPSISAGIATLRMITFLSIAGAFVVLYVSLVFIVWRGWATIVRQRTALQATQERLVQIERLAAIGELSAGVAHELRNPLGAVKNAVYYIRSRLRGSDWAQENPRVGEFLDVMDEEIASSDQIITDLMDFSRVNPPSVSPSDMETLVDTALERTVVKESVNLIKDFEPGLPQVSVDGEQVRRLLGNLIKNADDAMPEGGNLTFTAKTSDGAVELQVRDSGQGIPDADLAKVFDPLFTTKAKGIGMGLAIANQIVRRHEGTIDVTSKQGEGTTFTITLPVHKE